MLIGADFHYDRHFPRSGCHVLSLTNTSEATCTRAGEYEQIGPEIARQTVVSRWENKLDRIKLLFARSLVGNCESLIRGGELRGTKNKIQSVIEKQVG